MPDLVISTYPLFQVPLIAAIKAEDLDIPVMVVITDLITVHQVWFNEEISLITVPTEAVGEMALESGFSPSQIALTVIPVDPAIDALKDADVNDMRKSLAWKVDLISLLVMGR